MGPEESASMILNAYAVLDSFVIALRLVVAVLVVGLALRSWRCWRRGAGEAHVLEDRNYLLLLLAFLLLFLNLASWPILYLLLDSYVPEWPGVMCIYGVTQVGSGSAGLSRCLPGLLRTVEILKPVLVFSSGAWVMLYLANRGTVHAPLWGRILLVSMGLGTLAAIEAATEAAYLAIPKHEEFLAAGCCTAAAGDDSRFLPSAFLNDDARSWLSAAYFTVNAGMILTLFYAVARQPHRPRLSRLSILLLGAAAASVASAVFLIDVAAPTWLHLPHHHCAYDLIPRVPEAVLGIASFVLGTFAIGWACVAGWLGDCRETQPALAAQVRAMLVIALFAYLGSLVLVIVEFALA
jgi:hypothetical protein